MKRIKPLIGNVKDHIKRAEDQRNHQTTVSISSAILMKLLEKKSTFKKEGDEIGYTNLMNTIWKNDFKCFSKENRGFR